jgi:hypothetical protein
MRLASRSGLIATTLAIGAIAAPNAQAGGLFSTGPDPKGADQQEAQNFMQLYHHPSVVNQVPSATPTGAASGNSFDYGDATIGAGVVGGIALLTVAGGMTVRRRNQVRHS